MVRRWWHDLRTRAEETIVKTRRHLLDTWGRMLTAQRAKVSPAAGAARRKARHSATVAGEKARGAGSRVRRGCVAGLEKVANGSHRLSRRMADTKAP